MDSYMEPKPGKTYISPSLPAFGNKERKVRIASKAVALPDGYEWVFRSIVTEHSGERDR